MVPAETNAAPRSMVLAAVLSLLLLPPAVAMDEAEGIVGDMLVANVQMELNDYGYDAGPEDGVLGLVTVSAIRHFQADQGLPVTGRIDDTLLAHVADPRKGMRPGSGRGRAVVNRRVEEGSGADSHNLDLWMERNFQRTVGAFGLVRDGHPKD